MLKPSVYCLPLHTYCNDASVGGFAVVGVIIFEEFYGHPYAYMNANYILLQLFRSCLRTLP